MSKVLLIQPPFERFMGYSRYYYPIGLASIAAVLKRDGHNVVIYDADHNPGGVSLKPLEYMSKYEEYTGNISNYEHPVWQEIINVLRKEDADYIGISCYTNTVAVVKNLISVARANCQKAKVVVGGVHATLRPNDFAQLADYIVRNEGESAFLDIIGHPETLSGALPGNKAVIVEGRRIDDIGSLPYPALECLYDFNSYDNEALSIVMSSRGCPKQCKFCNSYDIWKSKTTRKSPEYFFNEIKRLRDEYGITDFYIYDDVFTMNEDWVDKFLALLAQLHVTWRCLSHISYLNHNLVGKLIDAGCRNIKVGIESGSDKMLKIINKGITLERVKNASNMLKDKNAHWSAYFIIGFPGETLEDIRQTQQLIQSISAQIVTVNIYTPLPDNRFNDYPENPGEKYSFRSPFNNFTQTMDNTTFTRMVRETFEITEKRNLSFTDH